MQSKTLDHYRQRLLKLQDRLIQDVNHTEEELREDIHTPGALSNVPTHNADADTEFLDTQVSLAQNEEGILEQVGAALERIAAGTYGRCQNCNREISAIRLDALPFTSLCINCARQQEGERKTGKTGRRS